FHRIVTGYGPDHYTSYFLYDKPVDIAAWRQYLSKREFCKLLSRYNRKQHFKVLEDKVAFGAACHRHGLPHPAIAFTCNYSGPESTFDNLTADDIATGFGGLAPGDYIVKTCSGSYGFNLWSITNTGESLQVHNIRQSLSPQEFATLLENSESSYLVQKKIEVARSLLPIMPGLACGSTRIYTFLRPDGTITLHYGTIKLTKIGATSDNFAGGDTGNLLAFVDMENYRIRRVIGKLANGLLSEVTHHPDTGVDLRDYPVPEVQEVVELGRRCALVFPDIPVVGWDIVVTDHGAVVLEGNPMFDPIGPQICANRGIKDIIPRLLEDTDNAD
ncbi:MAG: sugar-transfer associated ATP-grasp domain-containing protein, partial [Pseudomonadota bacterium]